MLFDVDRVGGAVSSDVNDYRIRLGFREVRNAAWLGVETSARKSFLGRSARDRTVTEVPDAGDHDGSAIVAVRMRLDLGVCRNAQANRVRAVPGRVPRDDGGTNA